MKRSAFWLWCAAGFMGLALLTTVGGWLALRQWPDVIGPRLPPWLAFRIAGLGEVALDAARYSFSDSSAYRLEHPLSPTEVVSCNATLCRALRGSRDEQLLALRLIQPEMSGFASASHERSALVFAFTTSLDDELRNLALEIWRGDGVSGYKQVRRLTAEATATDHSPLAPDQWVAGPSAGIAWRMLVFTTASYDHLTPNKYKKYLETNLALLLAGESEPGRFADDERDQAVVVTVLADLYGMTNDAALKPVLQRAATRIGQQRERLERLWQEDTTTACLTTMCLNSIRSNNDTPITDIAEPLRSSFDTWWARRRDDAPPLWHAKGQVIVASEAERWGAAICCGYWYGRKKIAPPYPPQHIADPSECTPLGRYLAIGGAYFTFDERWKIPFEQHHQALNNRQIITPNHDGVEGFWPANGDVSSEWETVFALLELSWNWPYNPREP